MEALPIFSSHYSVAFSRSILTLDKAGEIKENSPVSICSVAKKHELKQVVLIDSSFSGFQEAYRNLNEIGTQLIFGIKFHICDDVKEKSDKGRLNDSKIYLIAKNKEGLRELIKIYSKAATDGFYYYPRLDWNELNQVSQNVSTWIPFYDSFIFNNLLCYGVSIIPKFKNPPLLCVENHDLPFDDLIQEGINKYKKETKYETIRTHQVYFYAPKDYLAFQTYRCIHNRSTLSCPNLDWFGSKSFNYESIKG